MGIWCAAWIVDGICVEIEYSVCLFYFVVRGMCPFCNFASSISKKELDAEIAAVEDEIKSVMGEEETLLAGAFKVDWKTVISSRIDTTALKKALPEIAERFMKQTTTRRFCVR